MGGAAAADTAAARLVAGSEKVGWEVTGKMEEAVAWRNKLSCRPIRRLFRECICHFRH